MILYKNVDICDLESIMTKGILSMDECGNNNWSEGKRSSNKTSVVYLFNPIGELNTFPEYGIALLEVDCEAKEEEMLEYDVHKDDYREYITDKVTPEQIKRVIIPKAFKSRIDLPDWIKIIWCDMIADEFDEHSSDKKHPFKPMTKENMDLFVRTTYLNTGFNFFRGHYDDGKVLDIYNVKYIWNEEE